MFIAYLPKVFYRLHKACLCLSHQSTISIIDQFGEDYDEPVISWLNETLESLLQVSENFN